MNVNAAMKYFRKRRNMAVVMGDRGNPLAALESSTQCLILTGQLPTSFYPHQSRRARNSDFVC